MKPRKASGHDPERDSEVEDGVGPRRDSEAAPAEESPEHDPGRDAPQEEPRVVGLALAPEQPLRGVEIEPGEEERRAEQRRELGREARERRREPEEGADPARREEEA